MRKIIGFAGQKGSGKDTCADYLVNNHGFTKYAFATPLKRHCQEIFHLTDDQLHGDGREVKIDRFDKTPRQLMQMFGTDFIRQIDEEFWVHEFEEWLRLHHDEDVVVSDARFDNEIGAITHAGGSVFLINRPDRDVKVDNHISEAADKLTGIISKIDNDTSIADLHRKISDILS